jgi:S1-C subfamily serine protease
LAIALSAAFAATAVTLAVVASLGGFSSASGRSALRARHGANNPYGATADWLGMQIGGSPTGVFINAMNTSGAAIVSGLEPGDQIVAINDHMINNVFEIRSDTNRLKIGAPVEITVMRSSVEVHSQLIPMMQRPTIHR